MELTENRAAKFEKVELLVNLIKDQPPTTEKLKEAARKLLLNVLAPHHEFSAMFKANFPELSKELNANLS